MEQLKTIGRELAMGSQGGFGQSKEFLDLIKSIGEARSKAEEDRIVVNEIETLKRRIVEPDIPKRKMKEFIMRLVYIEMLGHDASFGYIHAVKMTHDDNLQLKRTGYLAVTLFLNEDHDLIILIVNTIQKDLKSDNYLVVCAALNAVCRLINEETIPAVLPQVADLLGHAKEAVRKKAVTALHRFYQKSPSSVLHLVSNFRKKLCDSDPGVMGAALCPLFDLITIDVDSYKDLVVSFVSILKQVAERRLPKSYDYHQTPAPFIQVKLLKILALLGSGDKKTSEHMYTIVGEIMRKCDSTTNIGNAILYECICCVSSIHPNPKLLKSAADAIAKFFKSDSHNLKYLGIDALGRLIKISPEIAEQHQLAVIDCLEDPDDTLKRKTFELLYKMTKSSNVEVIVDSMISYMISLNDTHYKTEIASRCIELAEQFAPSNQWFIQTMNKVFEHAGDLVNIKVAHNLMRLIAEGFGEDDNSADSQLRSSAVESYLHIMGEPKLPSVFLQVICWILGEYGTADGKYSAAYVTGKICDVAEAHSTDDAVRAYAISALTKIYSFELAAGRKIDMLPECQSFVEELLASHSTDLQQRAYELQAVLSLDPHALQNIMPMDASCEDVEVDKSLSFLNGYVQESLEKGARPYIPEAERHGVLNAAVSYSKNQDHQNGTYPHSLRFEAYELPKPSSMAAVPVSLSSSSSSSSTNVIVPISQPSSYHHGEGAYEKASASDSGIKLRLDGVQRKWGRPTYSPSPSPSAAPPPPAPSTSGIKPQSISNASNNKKQQKVVADVDPEKQKLAASLFGVGSKTERRQHSSGTAHHNRASSNSGMPVKPATPQPPPPDLLDLGGEPTTSAPTPTVAPLMDPFIQLEGLLDDVSQVSLHGEPTTTSKGQNDTNGHGGNATREASKGQKPRDGIEKDALVRQMGVTPSTQNPNLFRNLLG
ncbi:unnamed protein product [Cuscuta campestris]|uniref:Clathrin/coatomer adaptor adaptin-like N-terminal domain-containing protein n=1 Tax=Cuscuta campestris TaxID=132261 RepID=A0A484KB19_9ASTE|nr:unnamed protein product [Cuscuta campestris]